MSKLTHQHTQDTLGNINVALSQHNYDGADHYAHLLLTSFCDLKHTKYFNNGQRLLKVIQSLNHHGRLLDLNARNTKIIRKIHLLVISMFRA